jgi:hypothetical protein
MVWVNNVGWVHKIEPKSDLLLTIKRGEWVADDTLYNLWATRKH